MATVTICSIAFEFIGGMFYLDQINPHVHITLIQETSSNPYENTEGGSSRDFYFIELNALLFLNCIYMQYI